MRLVPLAAICQVQIGRTPSRSRSEYWGGDYPWATIGDLGQGRWVETTKECITELGVTEARVRLIPKGTLLLSFKLSIGKRAFAGRDLFTNEAIAALFILDDQVVDPDYLYWALGSIDYDRLVDRAAKGKTLNKKKLAVLPIPLPPIAEQKRIAEILDAADALRAKRREALAQLNLLLQSTFLEMFGDPVTNANGWETIAIADLTSTVTKGTTPTTYGMPFVPTGVPFVRVQNLVDGRVDLSDGPLFIDEATHHTLKRSQIKRGDILLSIAGTIGRAAIVEADDALNCNQAVAILRFKSEVNTQFVLHWLSTADAAKQVSRRGVTGTITNLSLGQIKALRVPAPPMARQNKFASIVEALNEQKLAQHAHLTELDTLFASLQSRAFRGEL